MDIQSLLQEYVDDNSGVGAAVGYIDHGKIQFFTYGKQSIRENKLVSKETIFEIGSITKTFTVLALIDMVEKGMVGLDDPVEKYLPSMKIPEAGGKKITLRHLAMHISGIPRLPDNFNPKNPNNPYEDYSVQDVYNFLNQYTLTKVPGESWEYSNIGVGLLGHILCLRSGKSYEALITELIKKINMPNTRITILREMEKNFANGYHFQNEVSHWDCLESFAGAGALRSNIQDMARFLAFNMGRNHGSRFEIMPNLAMDLGWLISRSNSSEIIWHNGRTGGFSSYIGFDPKTQRGVVILSNSTDEWPDELGMVLLDPDYKRPLLDKNLANDPEYLSKFAGRYEILALGQDLEIFVYGKRLASQMSSGEVSVLYPESFGMFGIKGFPDEKVRFTFDVRGQVSKIEVCQLDGTVLWEAAPKKTQM